MKNDIITINDKMDYGNLNISTLKQFVRKSVTESPSVKIVLSGNEHYQIDGRHYTLSKNRFIVVGRHSSEKVTIDAHKEVKGICIYPIKDLLNEVAKTRLSSLENLLDSPFKNDEFILTHNQYNFAENRTGIFLQQQIPLIIQLSDQDGVINLNPFLTGLAECLIDDQLELEGKLKQISTAKRTTKEELFRRVASAKNYISDNYTQKLSLDELAQKSLLSKYHFTRTFKDLFQLSPYQYLLQIRLQKAQEFLAKDYSYNETSLLIGFSDGKNLRKALKNLPQNRN